MNILCLGSSHTNHFQQAAEDSWAYALCELLNANGRQVTITNASISGATADSLAERYMHLRHQFDLVLVQLAEHTRTTLGFGESSDGGLAATGVDHFEDHLDGAYRRAIRKTPEHRFGLTRRLIKLYFKGKTPLASGVDRLTRHAPGASIADFEGYLRVMQHAHLQSGLVRIGDYQAILFLRQLIKADGPQVLFFNWSGAPFLDSRDHAHPYYPMVERLPFADGVAFSVLEQEIGREAFEASFVDALHVNRQANAILAERFVYPALSRFGL